MTASLWLAVFIIIALVAMLVHAGNRIETLLHKHEQNVDHAKCLSHVAHYVGNDFAANVLRAAADDYSSAEGQHQLDVIVHHQWVKGGPSIPSIWMSNRATSLAQEVTP